MSQQQGSGQGQGSGGKSGGMSQSMAATLGALSSLGHPTTVHVHGNQGTASYNLNGGAGGGGKSGNGSSGNK